MKEEQICRGRLGQVEIRELLLFNPQAHRQSRLSIGVFYEPKESDAPVMEKVDIATVGQSHLWLIEALHT